MEIGIYTQVSGIGRATGTEAGGKPRAAALEGGLNPFAKTESLNGELEALPDSRPEAVRRGKSLLETEHYPPDEILQRLARLLAVGLDKAEID